MKPTLIITNTNNLDIHDIQNAIIKALQDYHVNTAIVDLNESDSEPFANIKNKPAAIIFKNASLDFVKKYGLAEKITISNGTLFTISLHAPRFVFVCNFKAAELRKNKIRTSQFNVINLL